MTAAHVLLIGLPGSGKSTVGELVARLLGFAFVDVDREIERREQTSIAEIFRIRGEAEFRRMEAAFTGQCLEAPDPAVIVPGGGWAAQPGSLETVGARGIVVYLETSPETAAQRAPAGSRPVLSGSDVLGSMRALHARREPFYLKAHHRIPTAGRMPAELARIVAELAVGGSAE